MSKSPLQKLSNSRLHLKTDTQMMKQQDMTITTRNREVTMVNQTHQMTPSSAIMYCLNSQPSAYQSLPSVIAIVNTKSKALPF